MPQEDFNEGQIGLGVRAFKYVFKVSDRLMRMNQKRKLKFCHRSPSLKRYQDNLIPANFTYAGRARVNGRLKFSPRSRRQIS
jgi:hypothetical protein